MTDTDRFTFRSESQTGIITDFKCMYIGLWTWLKLFILAFEKVLNFNYETYRVSTIFVLASTCQISVPVAFVIAKIFLEEEKGGGADFWK